MSSDVADAFGELLASVRGRAGLSQEELGARSGLDRTTISQLERGVTSPRMESLIRIAGALGLDPAELLPPLRWRPPADSPSPTGKFVSS